MTGLLDRALAVLLGRITDDLQERRNFFWLTLAPMLSGAAAALAGGELATGFLTQTGFSMTQMGIMGSVAGLAGAFGLIAFMGLADRMQRRVRVYVICVLVTTFAPVLTVGLAFIPRSVFPLMTFMMALMASGVVVALVTSIPVMLDYPIFARTITVPVRGRQFGVGQSAASILGIGLGWLSAGVLKNIAYPMGYAWCFLAAAALILLRAASFSRLRELPELAVDGASRSPLPFAAIVDVLRLKEFQWLAPPHILRGLAVSVTAFAVPLATRYLGLPNHIPGYMTSASAAAGVLAGVVIGLIADRWGAAWTTLAGDLLYSLAMGALVVIHAPLPFLTLYLLMVLGRLIEDNGVPLGAINIVPPEHLGAFSAARLMVLAGSGAVGAPIFGYLFEHYNPLTIFVAAAAVKLLNGVWFWYVLRLKKPVDLAAEAEAAGVEAGAAEE